MHNHNALLEIVDCTDHCAEVNKKDAQYIADTMKPHIIKIDPSKQCVDFVIFDGASNVQKGGKILEAYDPRITSLSTEHATMLASSARMSRSSRKSSYL